MKFILRRNNHKSYKGQSKKSCVHKNEMPVGTLHSPQQCVGMCPVSAVHRVPAHCTFTHSLLLKGAQGSKSTFAIRRERLLGAQELVQGFMLVSGRAGTLTESQ